MSENLRNFPGETGNNVGMKKDNIEIKSGAALTEDELESVSGGGLLDQLGKIGKRVEDGIVKI